MDELHRSHMDVRRRDYFVTKRQRRFINALLRDGYDQASHEFRDEPFSVSLHMSDMHDLTPQNQNYLESGQADAQMRKLFGIIAARCVFSVDKHDNEYIVSLSRGLETS